MAETSSAPSDALRKLEEQLTCSICLDHYNDPRTLPCFHPFCHQCLEGLPLDHQGKKLFLSCPTCRTPTALPEAGFPVAFLINNLTEVHSLLKKGSGDQQASCDNCKKSDATGYCKQCSKFYCAKCLGVHVTFVDHTIISLDEVTRTLKQPDITLVKSKKIKDVHKSIEEVTNSKTCRPENGIIISYHGNRFKFVKSYKPWQLVYVLVILPAGVQKFMWIYPSALWALSYIHINLLHSRWYTKLPTSFTMVYHGLYITYTMQLFYCTPYTYYLIQEFPMANYVEQKLLIVMRLKIVMNYHWR